MSKPKYAQGRQITSVGDFESSKAKFFRWHGKTYHRGWIEEWKYHMLELIIHSGNLYEADPIGHLTENERKRRSRRSEKT